MKQTILNNKITSFLNQYIIGFLTVVLIFLITRILECLYLDLNNIIQNPWRNFGFSINFDVFFIVLFSFLLLLPSIIINVFHSRTASVFLKFAWMLIVFINVSLTHYFLTSNELLTNKLFEFSFYEIYNIVLAEVTSERIFLWIADIFLLSLSVLFLFFLLAKIKPKPLVKIITLIIYLIILIPPIVNLKHYKKELKHFDKIEAFYLANNKITILIESVYKKRQAQKNNTIDTERLNNVIQEFQKTNNDFEYTSQEFPLLHKKRNHNPLGRFFSEHAKKPNIVIIISESLSRSYSGSDAKFGSYTPFLDSLAEHGLYWSNFLSNCERSFGALPNILGSLPFGQTERGFINDEDYPDHKTLISLLSEHDYYSRFFYGGWSRYDKMDVFLKRQKTDTIIDEEDFVKKQYLNQNKGWGYNDKNLFEKSLGVMQENENVNYLNIYFTLSIHTPYNSCEEKYYDKKYLTKRIEHLNINPDSAFKQFPEKGMLSSILFADDALKEFINQYRKRPDFDNTIFIITGDHDIRVLPVDNSLDFYRVPLVIYSPLLKESKQFNSLSTHRDITPSLLQLLENNYGLDFPAENAFLGTGLDTSNVLFGKNLITLNLINNYLPNIICNQYLLSNGETVFEINQSLKLTLVKDPSIQNKLFKTYQNTVLVNNYVCKMNKIYK